MSSRNFKREEIMKTIAKVGIFLLSLFPCYSFADCPDTAGTLDFYRRLNGGVTSNDWIFGDALKYSFVLNTDWYQAHASWSKVKSLELVSVFLVISDKARVSQLSCKYRPELYDGNYLPIVQLNIVHFKDYLAFEINIPSGNGWHINQPPNQFSCEVFGGYSNGIVTYPPRTCSFTLKYRGF